MPLKPARADEPRFEGRRRHREDSNVSSTSSWENATIRCDVVVGGAGPVGLFAAFEAGVIGLTCHLVDALEVQGGQCIELYPNKPIFDIPAIPVCTARELVERLTEQCRPF